MLSRALSIVLFLAAGSVLAAQTLFQTLPAGFDSTVGNASDNQPVNTVNDQIWQWHYDSAEFATQAPIVITDLALRAKPGFIVGPFNFPQMKVTLIEARTNYAIGDHDDAFAENIVRSTLVRDGPWISPALSPLPGAAVGGRVWMGFDEAFVYDPSRGNDLIVQIEKCGTNLVWGTTIDAQSSPLLGPPVGGQMYGHQATCDATNANNILTVQRVPIVSIAYRLARQTLPRGFDQVDGMGATSYPLSTYFDEKWQWHYDSTEFDVQDPIVIEEIWVRPSHAGAVLLPFSLPSLKVIAGVATTDYLMSSHLPEFAANIEQQQVVRSGPWSGPLVLPNTGAVGDWVPLGVQTPFVFDPGSGSDFILQLEKCGSGAPWSAQIDTTDASSGAAAARFGFQGTCTALNQNAIGLNGIAPIIRIDYRPLGDASGAVTQFPWREDFEQLIPASTALPQGWLNVVGDGLDAPAQWSAATGPTLSLNTGPPGDHTSGIGNYVYVEDSVSDNPSVAMLTPVFDLSGLAVPRFSFWMHHQVAGGVANSLTVGVYVMPSGPFIQDVLGPIGPTGAAWVEQTLDLTPWAGQRIRLRFSVDNDNGTFTNDIAVDDVRVYDLSFQNGQAPGTFARLDAVAATDLNGEDLTLGLPGPYTTSVFYGEYPALTVSGAATQPFVLFAGTLAIGTQFYTGIGQFDLAGDAFVVVNGVNGGGAVPGIVYTDAAGDYLFPGPMVLPPGLTIGLQAAVFTGGPTVVALSNALVLNTL